MTGTIYRGTYVNGVTLSNPNTELPATVASVGYVTNRGEANGGAALLGEANAAWTITNLGRIAGGNGSASDGIRLLGGGYVANGASGSAAGSISGNGNAVEIDGKSGTVVNFGAILGLGAQGNGVALEAGGTVVNSGLIEGTAGGIAVAGGSVVNHGSIGSAAGAAVSFGAGGAVANDGMIEGARFGVYLEAGGAVTNARVGLITADGSGVDVESGRGVVVNLGTIAGGRESAGAAVLLGHGGRVINGGPGAGGGRALIAAREIGVYIGGEPQAGAVVNWGTIRSTGAGSIEPVAVMLVSEGSVANHGSIDSAGGTAVVFRDQPGTVTNFGRIAGGSAGAAGFGIYFEDGGLLTNEKGGRISAARDDVVFVEAGAAAIVNLGTIVGANARASAVVYLGGGGILRNGESGEDFGLIRGRSNGVVLRAAGTVANFGTIESMSRVAGSGAVKGAGVLLGAGGAVINGGPGAGGERALISAREIGVHIAGTPQAGTVVNWGTIRSTGAGAIGSPAVVLVSGGSVVNHGSIESAGGDGISFGAGGVVTNDGMIEGARVGVHFAKGGVVTNARHGVITARGAGVEVESGRGVVVNFGTIAGGHRNGGAAVFLGRGGTVRNGGPGAGGEPALIAARETGVHIAGASRAGTVVNWGTIRSTGAGAIGSPAVMLGSGGVVVNHGSIESAGGDGVSFGAGGAVTNGGMIEGAGVGVHFARGGIVTNARQGLIIAGGSGVEVESGRGVVVNLGTIASGQESGGAAVSLGAGGTVRNGQSGKPVGLILGQESGVVVAGSAGLVANFGTIESMSSGAGGGTQKGAGVLLGAGGTVINGGPGAGGERALISAREVGVYIAGTPQAGTVANWGTIRSTGAGAVGSAAVMLVSGGTVANHGAIDSAGGDGIAFAAGGAVTNDGTVEGAEVGVYLADGGIVVNGGRHGEAGLIRGKLGVGVLLANGAGRVTNFGRILSAGSAAVLIAAGGMVANHGLIESAAGSGIAFDKGLGTVMNSGSVVSAPRSGIGAAIFLGDGGIIANRKGGVVEGGLDAGILSRRAAATIVNSGTIESLRQNGVYLAAGGILINGSGGRIDGGAHGVYLSTPGGTVINRGTIAGGSAGFAAVGSGSATLFNFGTVESAAGAGGIAVEFAGHVGGDVLVVEPHAVFVGAVEGGGQSEIEFVGGGAAPMGGVDGFATIMLANGVRHSLGLSAANFADVTGGVITIFDGNKGNRVSAAGASDTDAIIVHVGTGGDVLTGNAGTNEFVFGAPGRNTITNFGISLTNELVFSNSGFDLGLENAGMTPQLLPSRLFVSNGTGSFTNARQRFAYDTSSGDLFYSASGTSIDERLVVALTGAPPLTTTPYSHLFYVS